AEPAAGSRRSRYVVQVGIVAVLDAGLAGANRILQDLLSDNPADHRIRHPVFLGRADDHAGDSFHGQGSLPRSVLALAGAHGKRRENVEIQRYWAGSSGAQPAV